MLNVESIIRKQTGASAIESSEVIQNLWSGYGWIKRYQLSGSTVSSVIAKHIQPPSRTNHPRGWNSDLSHQRKLKSYQVERVWYSDYVAKMGGKAKVPACYYCIKLDGEMLLILEDLNDSGFSKRLSPSLVTLNDAKNCLAWLAHFHGHFLGRDGKGLWEKGTYWHLDTRPDELTRMQNASLKKAASAIDQTLTNATYQTLVHGDAKLANFCFGSGDAVAAVDFQYVGKGCGMKDVAYLVSSCFEEEDCEKYESELLTHYFSELEVSINKSIDFHALKSEWCRLYHYAWADFYRFLDGWSPGHWKMHAYSARLVNQVLKELSDES